MNLMSSLVEDIKFVSFSRMWAQIQTQTTDDLWQKAGFNKVESQIQMQKNLKHLPPLQKKKTVSDKMKRVPKAQNISVHKSRNQWANKSSTSKDIAQEDNRQKHRGVRKSRWSTDEVSQKREEKRRTEQEMTSKKHNSQGWELQNKTGNDKAISPAHYTLSSVFSVSLVIHRLATLVL